MQCCIFAFFAIAYFEYFLYYFKKCNICIVDFICQFQYFLNLVCIFFCISMYVYSLSPTDFNTHKGVPLWVRWHPFRRAAANVRVLRAPLRPAAPLRRARHTKVPPHHGVVGEVLPAGWLLPGTHRPQTWSKWSPQFPGSQLLSHPPESTDFSASFRLPSQGSGRHHLLERENWVVQTCWLGVNKV